MFRDRTPDAFAWLHPAHGASDGMTDKEKGLSPSPLFAFSRGARIFLRLEKRHAVRYPDQPFA